MILKLILFGLIIYGLYRLMGGSLLPNKKSKKESNPELPEDTMVECQKCSTYVSISEAIKYKGKYYCSAECLPKKGE